MAWNSQGEEVLAALNQHVWHLSPQKQAELGHTYDKAINPYSRAWTSLNGITSITLQNRENVWHNLGLAMLRKQSD